jgi:hypothetical protein
VAGGFEPPTFEFEIRSVELDFTDLSSWTDLVFYLAQCGITHAEQEIDT